MRENDRFTVVRERPWKTQLPVEKFTGIAWPELVELLAKEGILMAKRIRYENKGVKGGTRTLDGGDMFRLWTAVERKRIVAERKHPSN